MHRASLSARSALLVVRTSRPPALAALRPPRGSPSLQPPPWTGMQRRQQYYRAGEWTRFKKSSGPRPEAVVASLIAANCLVTMSWYKARQSRRGTNFMLTHFTTSAQHLATGRFHTLLTSTFSHAEPGHLMANMFGLYFFGHQICEMLGTRRFLGLYLTSGVLSSLIAVLEQQRTGRHSLNLGASGAVNSITAMTALLFPHSTFLIFGVLPMPAWLAGSLFISKDAYAWLTDRRDGIGHVAHLGGALCGGIYYAHLRRSGMFRRF